MRRSLVELTLMIVLLFVVPSSWAGQRPEFADDYPSDVASVWFDTLYDLVTSEAIAYPEASRIYGVSAVALYEAVVPGALAPPLAGGSVAQSRCGPAAQGTRTVPLAYGG